MTLTGERVDDELFARVRKHFSEDEAVELVAIAGYENMRSKMNVALGVEAQGFCALPGVTAGGDPGPGHGRVLVRRGARDQQCLRARRPAPVGKATATLLDEPRHHQLIAAHDNHTITITAPRGVVPDRYVEPVLIDLLQRIWPNIPPAHAPSRR